MPNEHFLDQPFLPYGYNVPTTLEECYTWETAICWLAKKVNELEQKIEDMEGNTDAGN